MIGLSYKRLVDTTNKVPPFRGNKNRFPLATRRENTKYFLVREEDGQRVFDIVYGQEHYSIHLTKEEYETLEAQESPHIRKYPAYGDDNKPIPNEFTYVRYEARPNVLGTVRPDNTFEFTKKNYHQGERLLLSRFSRGWFHTDSRRGGLVYKTSGESVFHPIYRGMKVVTETMVSVMPYEVVIHHVDRKKSKAVLADYEHFYKVSEVMLKNMTMNMALDTAREVVDEIWKNEGGTQKYRSDETYFNEAEKLINVAPLDAFILYCIALNVGRVAYQMRWPQHSSRSKDVTSAHDELFMGLKRRLSKEIYKRHAEIFKEVKYGTGKRYPACDWGVKIIVNGQEVEQYT